MKYRHAHHAGNFADVHKHVTLIALLGALRRKDKGFLYFETHAGRGHYARSAEASQGIDRLLAAAPEAQELRDYVSRVAASRSHGKDAQGYPGSPLLAAQELRPQDRAVLVEFEPTEARALELATRGYDHLHIERDDGFARLRAHLPPRERRGLTFIDPPYEETHRDFARVEEAIATALQKFATGVIAAWYPIKAVRDVEAWHARLSTKVAAPLLVSELWLYPRDSRVALNGSGLVFANVPYQIEDRMRLWLPELHAILDTAHQGSWRVTGLPATPSHRV